MPESTLVTTPRDPAKRGPHVAVSSALKDIEHLIVKAE